MYVAGVLLNRSTVFFIAYQPFYAVKAYIPAIGEFALTLGLILTIVFVYRALVTLLPVLPASKKEGERIHTVL
jgi:Ni/Fe-hydrogenase subunit HybB-like protein